LEILATTLIFRDKQAVSLFTYLLLEEVGFGSSRGGGKTFDQSLSIETAPNLHCNEEDLC
jgi:hypothetical protein